MRQFLLIVALLAASSPLLAQDDRRRDGSWWLGLGNAPEKHSYAIGIFDGMIVGSRLSYWPLPSSQQSRVAAAFNDWGAKYFSKITAKQLVDGLDEFYLDNRNRNIQTEDAIWLVANAVAGKPQAQLDKMVESYREAARRSP